MSWMSAVQAVSAIALVVGVIFGIVQIRYFRAAREREAAIELLHSFQTAEFSRALYVGRNIPLGLSRSEIEERLGPDMQHLYSLLTTWETLGVLVYLREVRLSLVEEFFSGAIVISWQRFGRFVQEEREALGRSTLWEWFQWLAERIEEHESKESPVPAHIAHRDWVARD